MKGILICGGTGSRLKPLTDITNKSLLPVYNRPLIHFPLQVLLDAGIKEIAVVTGTEHMDQIAEYLGSGSRFDCEFAFKVQEKPGGIAQALGLAEEFADDDSVCAILGDNIFFDDISKVITSFLSGGHIFCKEVPDPERFGVVSASPSPSPSPSSDDDYPEEEAPYIVEEIEEKPQQPKGNLAQTGCYLFDNRCFEVIKSLQPSARGELEITDVSKWYLERNELTCTILKDEWIDAGTFDSLLDVAILVRERKK